MSINDRVYSAAMALALAHKQRDAAPINAYQKGRLWGALYEVLGLPPDDQVGHGFKTPVDLEADKKALDDEIARLRREGAEQVHRGNELVEKAQHEMDEILGVPSAPTLDLDLTGTAGCKALASTPVVREMTGDECTSRGATTGVVIETIDVNAPRAPVLSFPRFPEIYRGLHKPGNKQHT